MKLFTKSLVTVTAIAVAVALTSCGPKDKGGEGGTGQLSYGGGPQGGSFIVFATAMSKFLTDNTSMEVTPQGTGGSSENLRKINKGSVDFGIVYSGDAYLGWNGKLPKDDNKYQNVRMVAYLYGAPAQLVTTKDSGIDSPMDLKGKKVAVGNPGSGAFNSAQRYFKTLGIWDKMKREQKGYSAAAKMLKDGQIDAFWVLVAYPTSAIIEAATVRDIKLVDTIAAGEKAGFFKKYPFYKKTEVPAKTYKGQNKAVKTFFDSALMAANINVKDNVVYNALKKVYTQKGLQHMVSNHKRAKQMGVKSGIKGMATPLHPGAEKFWKEKGLEIPKDLQSSAGMPEGC